MKYPPKSGKFRLGPWVRGLNNVDDPSDLRTDELMEIENFTIDDQGKVETRAGTVKRISGTSVSGLYRVSSTYGLFFDDGTLYRFNVKDWTTTALASGYSKNLYTSWATLGPRIFFTNGNEHGRIHVPTWDVLSGFGTPTPGLTVTLSALAYGDLPIGRYFVAITYVDGYGEESACPGIHFQELTAVGGINVNLSGTVPSSVSSIRVYLTEANGKRDELYRVAEIDAADTDVQLTFREFGSPLAGLFFDEIPTPDLITIYNGYLFFAIEDRVWHSHTLRYGIYHIDHSEINWYPERVTVLERGQDGIFVVADKTYAYVGASPKDFRLFDNIFDFPAAKFSGRQIEGTLFNPEETRDLPYWFSSRGAVVGLPGGKVLPLSKGRAEPDQYRVGVSGTVEYNGTTSLVTAVDDRQGPNDAVSLQDSFSVKVIKRGLSDE